MLSLTVNQCLIVMTFLVPFVIWLASRPINDYISLPDKDKEQSNSGYNANYGAIMRRQGAYIQQQGRYYN